MRDDSGVDATNATRCETTGSGLAHRVEPDGAGADEHVDGPDVGRVAGAAGKGRPRWCCPRRRPASREQLPPLPRDHAIGVHYRTAGGHGSHDHRLSGAIGVHSSGWTSAACAVAPSPRESHVVQNSAWTSTSAYQLRCNACSSATRSPSSGVTSRLSVDRHELVGSEGRESIGDRGPGDRVVMVTLDDRCERGSRHRAPRSLPAARLHAMTARRPLSHGRHRWRRRAVRSLSRWTVLPALPHRAPRPSGCGHRRRGCSRAGWRHPGRPGGLPRRGW